MSKATKDKGDHTEVDTPQNVPSTSPADDPTSVIKAKIIHTLTIYPFISASMLQVGIGTALPPSFWRPALQKLVDEGVVKEHTVNAMSVSERAQTYTVLHLAKNEYVFQTNGDDGDGEVVAA